MIAIPRQPGHGGEPAAAPGTRARPALFRALGSHDPPDTVLLHGKTFTRSEIVKHDSWAATAIYTSSHCQAVCKFNRLHPVFIVPVRWLGRMLASRERRFMQRLTGIDGIPVSMDPVFIDGHVAEHAVSHEFIPGHPLRANEQVDDQFFPRLAALLAEVHGRGIAHVDLHKRENILVDDDGKPHLIDFQISFGLPRNRWAAAVFRGTLRMLQRCDEYHLLKHRVRIRPDQARMTEADIHRLRPWWIRLHRIVAVPFRTLRRSLLTRLRIRSGPGQATSEVFPEAAFQGIVNRNLCSPH